MNDARMAPLQRGDALLIVDVQRDFLPGGSLAVTGGDRVIEPLNRCIALFTRLGLPVFATRDAHPDDHCSFRDQGGPWPPHCVVGTPGVGFPPALRLPDGCFIASKATRADEEAYSGFAGTDLERRLRHQRVHRLFVGGLATDYCVAQTVRDACQRGLAVVVLRDATAAVDAEPGDGDRAIERMAAEGAVFVPSTGLFD